ncbi:glycosyl hydrolase family 8 [Streptomyces sp. IBSNAI002]|uniref:glycosyl hydrolase family 8 n=1 Tax=Streptomyces sp. IBSNAI002 TaxID=3457500 RepID=UPI003FD395AA
MTRPKRKHAYVAAAVVTVLAAAALTPMAAVASPDAGWSGALTTNGGGTWYTGGQFTVRNTGGQSAGDWRLEFDVPSGAFQNHSSWFTDSAQHGTRVVITPKPGHTVGGGQSVQIGFGISGDGSTGLDVRGCSLGGAPVTGCTGATTPPETDRPGAPRAEGSVLGATSVKLTWTAATDNAGVTGYEVLRGGTVIAEVGGSARERTVSGLTPDTQYSFSVRAKGAAGNVSAESNRVTLRTQTPAKPPVGGPSIPFGSHTFSYAPGTITVSGSQPANDAKVVEYYKRWKAAFVRSDCGNGWSAVASPDADHPYVAEAQGYGLTVLATMAGADAEARTTFDRVLKYVLDHPSAIDKDLHAAEQNSACQSVNGGDSATDGDLEIAYALLLADRQWGSTGTYDYKALAVKRINAIKRSEIVARTGLVNLGDWSSGTWDTISRTSDWVPGHFRAFGKATGDPSWDTVRDKHQNLIADLQSRYAPMTGLLPDFVINTDTGPRPATGQVLESPNDGGYSWNACRDPWRIGVDALTSGDSRSKAAVAKMNAWIKKATGGNPDQIRTGYRLDGTVTQNGSSPAFIAPFAVAAATDPASQSWLDALWNKLDATPLNPSNYYGSTIQLQAMIAVTGNHWTP